MSSKKKVPITYMRGGTSKGAFILASDLPNNSQERDEALLAIYGSPDVRQIDGIGGADPLTSKAAILSQSSREGIDIDYTFGQVSINSTLVDYKSNCGNMSAGVGLFAIEKGLVEAVEPFTSIMIYNTNTKKVIESIIPVKKGAIDYDFGPKPEGLPSTGSKVTLNFLDSGGSKTGKVLPTGNVKDQLALPDGTVLDVSYVDAATPSVFVKAEDIGLSGTVLPEELESDADQLKKLEYIRSKGAEVLGLVDHYETASTESPAVPKVIFVSSPEDYKATNGEAISKGEIDLVARAMAMQKMHKAYAVTGGICTSVAAFIEGTVVNEVLGKRADNNHITVGHPSGTMNFIVSVENNEANELVVTEAKADRTARIIMDGVAYLP